MSSIEKLNKDKDTKFNDKSLFQGNKKPRNESNESPKVILDKISLAFLNSNTGKYSEIEMEAKFGTRGIKYLTKMDYDNVVKKLTSLKWEPNYTNGEYLLRIQPEFLDVRTGQFKTNSDFNRFRTEIQGFNNIQEYCKTNSLKIVNDKNYQSVKINRKTPVIIEESTSTANFDDFNFRVTLSNEETISKTGKIGTDVFENWNKTKKVFRYMNRVTFTHNDYPFKIDLSIVKSSSKNEKGWMIQTYTIDESNVFNNPESYEIEIEVDHNGAKQKYKNQVDLSNGLQKIVTQVLSGLQKTNFPISYLEQKEVLQNYHKLLFEEDFKKKNGEYIPKKNVHTSDFIGPGLVTLDMMNIGKLNPDVIVPNITEPYAYCVTEKADGDRELLYVNGKGRIYFINTNMNVMFSGAKTEEEKCFNSLLDGELILHNKLGQFINTFAVFDIYYINKVDIRARPFINTHTKDEKYFKDGCRLPILKEFIKMLNPLNINTKKSESMNVSNFKAILDKYNQSHMSPIKIISKKFYPTFDSFSDGVPTAASSKYNIFEANNYLLRRIADENFDYEIDGLIFTPTLLGVGGNKFLEAGPKKKITWPYIFKWKPSEATMTFPKSYNTIDFLVVTKKGADGKDIITPIFENGINNYESTHFNQFKTIILTVGFDASKHGYINPCQDVLDDKFSVQSEIDNEEGYKPKQFFPSNPFDAAAGLCNVMLEMDSNGVYNMFTEERQVFDDKMVVEFRYDMSKQGIWKWIPMRVRYDKTADFRSGNSVGANDYKTANSNWHSIHNPVTEKMLATGEDIPGIEVSDDVYYNSVTSDKMTQRMRDFHNLFVKKVLIQGVSKRGNNLIDFACGKAGDFPKWISAELSFVFGIDISKDNIENRLNGACARYLNFKTTTKKMPHALFVNGNSALNIRSGTNMFNDKANEITKSVFGSIGIDNSLGPAVVRQHGKVHNGFDVSSCQFAIHYMFENNRTFYNFMRNVAECTKLYGYFIATCYDGRTIFNMLKKKRMEESVEIYVDDKKVWSISKRYDAITFEDNESCLGYKIDVYQDSINQTLPEYLVNFDFLTSTMDKYGFTLITKEEARQMKLPEGSGMFSELFNVMENDVNKNPEKASDYKDALYMKDYEKDISFLNRFFIYKKTSTRNAEKLTKTLLDQLPDEIVIEQAGTMLAREAVKQAEEIIKPKSKKLNTKLKLQEATEALEEVIPVVKKSKLQTKKIKEIEEPSKVIEVIEEQEEEIDIIPAKKKKTTRKKKLVDFEIDGDEK